MQGVRWFRQAGPEAVTSGRGFAAAVRSFGSSAPAGVAPVSLDRARLGALGGEPPTQRLPFQRSDPTGPKFDK
jgi:hypothetical protein